MPALSPYDLVYAAGAPSMVEGVARMAREAGAKCYADPFEPMADGGESAGLFSRTIAWFGREARVSSPSIAPALQRRGQRMSDTPRTATDKFPLRTPY
jgi:3-phenylpropionate/trans-cinnamate dioxygenase ferredoxin reductase subunit